MKKLIETIVRANQLIKLQDENTGVLFVFDGSDIYILDPEREIQSQEIMDISLPHLCDLIVFETNFLDALRTYFM